MNGLTIYSVTVIPDLIAISRNHLALRNSDAELLNERKLLKASYPAYSLKTYDIRQGTSRKFNSVFHFHRKFRAESQEINVLRSFEQIVVC